MPTFNLYQQVVNITYEYLGPAADRFVCRQIRNHLNKDPERLERRDLKQLIDWIRLAMSLLSDKPSIVDRYIADLQKLTSANKVSVGHGKTSRA